MIERTRKNFGNSFVSASLLYILSSVLIKGISFITTPIFTRLMGTADYGIVSNFSTYANLVGTFICLQVSSGLLAAKVNHAPDRFAEYVRNVVGFAAIAALVQSAVIILLRNPISSATKLETHIVPLVCIVAFGTAINNVISSYFIAVEKPMKKVAYSVSAAVGMIALGVLCVFLSPNKSMGRIIGYAVSYTVIAIFGMVYFLRRKGDGRALFRGDIKYALAFGIPLIPHLLANLINGSADKIFIINICGESQNGIYTIAYNIGQLALVLATACSDAWNPWYFKNTKAKTDRKVIESYFSNYALTIGMCFVGVMFLAPEIMKLMAPSAYWSGTSCILYVALGVFFLFLYRFPLGYEQLMSNTKYIAPATILAALCNVGLNSILIPRAGIIGAAVATTISYVILWIFHETVARKIVKGYNIRLRLYIVPIIVNIAGFVLAMLFLEKTLIRLLILAAFCIGYLAVMYFKIKAKKKDAK